MISINCDIYSSKDDISNNEMKYIMVKAILNAKSRKFDYNFDENKKMFKYEIYLNCGELDKIRSDYKHLNKPKKRHTLPKSKLETKMFDNKIFIKQSLTKNVDNTNYVFVESNSD